MIIYMRLKGGDVIAIHSSEIEDARIAVEPEGGTPNRILIHPQGEAGPTLYRTPDLFCAMLRAVSGQERMEG